MPIVSVVIPTYNRSWGLVRSVESVLEQSFQDFEIIIADDCSSDDTYEVIKSIQDPRIRYFRQAQNVGVAENWGTGVNLAQGEFITLLMDDDFYKTDFLANRVSHLISNPNLIVVFSSYELRDLENQLLDTIEAELPDQAELSPEDLLKCILQRKWFIGTSMYRREAVQSVWEKAKCDHMIVDFSLGIYLALQALGKGLYLRTKDFVMSAHSGQNSQAKLKEVFLQTDNALSRILTEFSSHPNVNLVRREQSNWKVLQARYLDLKSDNNFVLAQNLILDALKTDISNIWAWKQLSKLLVLGKL
ncbi:glycosyl transferase [Leptolyngbyaceae cyanobacterium JSC-12]|nr:glycosyl transferase [Leptolyngbyaceae cyanobacterium JSC-12]